MPHCATGCKKQRKRGDLDVFFGAKNCQKATKMCLNVTIFASFIEVFNARFVDERPTSMSDLDRVAVVPLDVSFQLFSIFKHKAHQRLCLDLLLKIEGFRMRTLMTDRSCVVCHRLVRCQLCFAMPRSVTLDRGFRHWGAYELTWS